MSYSNSQFYILLACKYLLKVSSKKTIKVKSKKTRKYSSYENCSNVFIVAFEQVPNHWVD